MRTSILIGSAYLPAQTMIFGGVGVEVPAGTWYPSSDSVLGALQSALATAGLSGASVRLCNDGLIRISGTGLAFSLNWTSATELRDMLGFTSNLSGSASYVATYPSPQIFIPGYPATRSVSEGLPGYDVDDARTEIDRSGTIVQTTYYHTQVWDELSWSPLPLSKITTEDVSQPASNGTWRRFRRVVLLRNHPFRFYEIAEVDGTTSAITLPTRIGTYKVRSVPKDVLDRRIANSNNLWGISIDTIRVGA